MTIGKKETKKKTTTSSASSSSKVVTSNVKEESLVRSESGLQIQDLSDTSGSVVTYKLDQNGGAQTGAVETVTTYYTSDGGQPVAQTVSYPKTEDAAAHYVQYVSEGETTSSQTSHSISTASTSNVLNTGFVGTDTSSYTVTEPKEEVSYTKKQGDSSWNGKFTYEQPAGKKTGASPKPGSIQKAGSPQRTVQTVSSDPNTIVEYSSTSSSSKKSSSVQKSSSSSYVIEIVDGKERIIDSKHHESELSKQSGSEEHATERGGTHIPTEAHYLHQASDKTTAYDSAIPELQQPKTKSSELSEEMHIKDGVATATVRQIKDGHVKEVTVSKTEGAVPDLNSKTLENTRIHHTGALDSTTSTTTNRNINEAFILDSSVSDVSRKDVTSKILKDSKSSQDFISHESVVDEISPKDIKNTTDVTRKVVDSTSLDSKSSQERVRTDTAWDGTFTYEKPVVRKQHTDSRNFFGTSATDYTTESQSKFTKKEGTRVDNYKTSQTTKSKDFYDQSNRPDKTIDSGYLADVSQNVTYLREAPDQTTKKTLTSDTKNFYGHSSGTTDNVVVTNIYDTKSTQNVIGSSKTTQEHSVIYDSSGKIIQDTSDIIYSNDRNYGKTGWNGMFLYEQPKSTGKITDTTQKVTYDSAGMVISDSKTITGAKTTPKRPQDAKTTETTQTIIYDSTGRIISDTSDTVVIDAKTVSNAQAVKTLESTQTIVYDSTGKVISDTSDVKGSTVRRPQDVKTIGSTQRIVYDSTGKVISDTTDVRESTVRRPQDIKTTETTQTIIYDSTGKVISDTTDIKGSTTRRPQDGKTTETTQTIVYDSTGKIISDTTDVKGVPTKRPQDGKTTETTQTFIYDSTGKVISDTTDVVYTYDKNQSGWNGKFIYEQPQKPRKGPTDEISKTFVDQSSRKDVYSSDTKSSIYERASVERTIKDGKEPRRGPTEKSPERKRGPTEKSPERRRGPFDRSPERRRDGPTEVSPGSRRGPEVPRGGSPRRGDGSKPTERSPGSKDRSPGSKDAPKPMEGYPGPKDKSPRPTDRTISTRDDTITSVDTFVSKTSSTDFKTSTFRDSKTFVDDQTIVESYTIIDGDQPKRVRGPGSPERSTDYRILPKGPKDAPRDTTEIYETRDSFTNIDRKSSIFKDSKTVIDDKTVVETYEIVDGRPKPVRGPDSPDRSTDGRILPKGSPRDITTEVYETRDNFTNVDRKSSIYRDSKTFVDDKTVVENYTTFDDGQPKSVRPGGPKDDRVVPRGPKDTRDTTTTEIIEKSDSFTNIDRKSSVYEQNKTFVDSKTIVESYIITSDGRRVKVDTVEQHEPTKTFTSTKQIEDDRKYTRRDRTSPTRKPGPRDRSSPSPSRKTVNGDVVEKSTIDVVDRVSSHTVIDEKSITDVRSVVSRVENIS